MQLKGRLWLEKNGQTFVSWGRVVFLQRIDETGSVSAAAKSMGMSFSHAWQLVESMNALAQEPLVGKRAGGMSFSHAWQLVESMNALAQEPLVGKRAGGRGGGGAWLTAEGKKVVAEFWSLVADFQKWIEKKKV